MLHTPSDQTQIFNPTDARSQSEEVSYQQMQKVRSETNNSPKGEWKIPLILKKMNTIEKYVKDFNPVKEGSIQLSSKCDYISQRKPNATNGTNYKQSNLASHTNPIHLKSMDLNIDELEDIDVKILEDLDRKCYVKYQSIKEHTSQDKLDILTKIEKDYLKLKQKVQPIKSQLTRNKMSGFHKNRDYSSVPRQHNNITGQQIQKEIKTALIQENGRNYYADLYLLKKGRDQIINSLSSIGKTALSSIPPLESNPSNYQTTYLTSAPTASMSYEEKIRHNEQQFIKNKILKERSIKKNKMIKYKNLHWNVYYDMLALSQEEKHKLKSICKFSNTYGIN